MFGNVNGRNAPVFFDPTEMFMIWFKEHVGELPVIDVGCGTGYFAKILHESGIKVMGLDMFPVKNQVYDAILEQDGTVFDYPEGVIVTLTRPNRGDWIHETIEQALKTAREVLYIGLPKHYEEDIEPLIGRYDLNNMEFDSVAGLEGERVYIITEKSGLVRPIVPLPAVSEIEEEEPTPIGRNVKVLKPPTKKGEPCTKCGSVEFFIEDEQDGRHCFKCGMVNVEGLDVTEKFKFRPKEIDGESYYIIGGRKIKEQTIMDYLPYRHTGGVERVTRHKAILVEAGFGVKHSDWDIETRRDNNWVDYFERWIEAFLGDDIGHDAYQRANLVNCTGCGKELKLGDPRYNYPSGVKCMDCG